MHYSQVGQTAGAALGLQGPQGSVSLTCKSHQEERQTMNASCALALEIVVPRATIKGISREVAWHKVQTRDTYCWVIAGV